jgi:hypothetical protein
MNKYPRLVLFVDGLLLLLFTLVLSMRVVTAVLTILVFNLVLVLWLRSPNVVKGTPAPITLFRDPDALVRSTFLSSVCGSMVFVALLVYVFQSGSIVANNVVGISFPQSLLSLIVHFFLGFAVILVSAVYGGEKLFQLKKVRGSMGRALKETLTDLLGAGSILMFLLFATQIVPVIPKVVLPAGSACFVGALFAIYTTRRSHRFSSIREWASSWSHAIVTITFCIPIVMMFGYTPYHVHLWNPYSVEYHGDFFIYAIVAVLVGQVARVVAATVRTPGLRKVGVLGFGLGRLIAAMLVGVLLLVLVRWVSTGPIDWKPIHDYLLPIPETLEIGTADRIVRFLI